MTSVRDRARLYQAAAAETAAFGDESRERLPRVAPPAARDNSLRGRGSARSLRAPQAGGARTGTPAEDAAREHVDDAPVSTSSVAAAARRYQVAVGRLRADQERPGSQRLSPPRENPAGQPGAESFHDAGGPQDALGLLGTRAPAAPARPPSANGAHSAATRSPLDLLGTRAPAEPAHPPSANGKHSAARQSPLDLLGTRPPAEPAHPPRADGEQSRLRALATSPASVRAGGYLSDGHVSGGSFSSAYFSDDASSDGIVTLDVLAPGVEFTNDAVFVADEEPLPPDTPRPSRGAPRTASGLAALDLELLRSPSLHRPRSIIAPDREPPVFQGVGSTRLESALVRQLSSSGRLSRASALSADALPVRVGHGGASFAMNGVSIGGLVVSPNPSAGTVSSTPSSAGSPRQRAREAAGGRLDAATRERAEWREKRSSSKNLPKAKAFHRTPPALPAGRVSLLTVRKSIVRLHDQASRTPSPPPAPVAPRASQHARAFAGASPDECVMSMAIDPFVDFMANAPSATRHKRGPFKRLWLRVRRRHKRKLPAGYR